MEYLYLGCVLASIGMLLWLKIFDVRKSVNQFISLLIIVVSNLGYYFISISTTLQEAIVAQKMVYIGGLLLPLFYFFLVAEICHISIPRGISALLVVIQCILYGFVLTIGINDWFYKTIDLTVKNGVVILSRTYGPLHILYPVTTCLYQAFAIIIVVYSLKRRKSVNRSSVIIMMVFSILSIAAYIWERVISLDYEILPLVYVALMFGTLFPVYDSNIYTVYENTDIIREQLNKVGFLTFDKNLIYKGCDEFMARVFPELKKYYLGQKIRNCSDELQNLIYQITPIKMIYKGNKDKEHVHTNLEGFVLNDKYYEGMVHIVTNTFGQLKGYTIELWDDTEHHNVLELQAKYNEELASEVHAKTKKIRAIQQKTILGMAQMVESRDLSTGGHIRRTSDVVRIFAKKLRTENYGLNKKFLHLVIRSAPMHDIGKIGVDDAVLRKQGRFTDEEYAAMKKHAEIGYHMVSEILSEVEEPDFVQVAENVAHYHHEKVNGTGYPEGLKGDEIPVEARIMALADVFDALVSKRCYKEAFSYDKAFEIISNDAGSHFDPDLARIFLMCRPELEEYYNKSEV